MLTLCDIEFDARTTSVAVKKMAKKKTAKKKKAKKIEKSSEKRGTTTKRGKKIKEVRR